MGRTGSKIESGMMGRAPGNHKHDHGFADGPRHAEHDGCTDAGQRGRDDHADQRFPAGRAKGQRRFAQRAGNREQRVLSHGTDGRHAHERQHERGVQQVEPGIRSEPVLKERGDDDHAEKADDNRRQRRQQFDDGLTMRRVRLAAISAR